MNLLLPLIVSISFFTSPVNTDVTQVEIFDIETEQVVKTVPTTACIQSEVENYIDSIYDIFKGVNPVGETGFMVKIPLDPTITIDNEWLQSEVDTVIIIQPENEDPYLLTFDENNRPRVFLFDSPIEGLLEQLEYP
ncbi:hypothetical protein ACTWQB_04845 [Piscibacillus sp. B03]|uniref:hypothetical protein n=1 Tax=Piscibacillus sp. B03 TaxID=3457430 RepID=UPI003FCD0131